MGWRHNLEVSLCYSISKYEPLLNWSFRLLVIDIRAELPSTRDWAQRRWPVLGFELPARPKTENTPTSWLYLWQPPRQLWPFWILEVLEIHTPPTSFLIPHSPPGGWYFEVFSQAELVTNIPHSLLCTQQWYLQRQLYFWHSMLSGDAACCFSSALIIASKPYRIGRIHSW